MAQTISPIQVYQPKSWSGLTTDNHLSAIFAEQPQLVSDVISRVFGDQQYKGLNYLLSKVGSKEMATDADYEWFLKGDDRKSINIAAYSAADSTKPGMNQTIFYLELEEKYFVEGDVLVLDNREYHLRIMGPAENNGTNHVYPVQLITTDDTLFVPTTLLAAGKRVSKIYTLDSRTLGQTYGETTFTSPFKMRNSFSTLAKQYVVPANMHDRPVAFKLLDPKSNKSTMMWTRYAEWEMMCQWEKEKENNLIYAKSNKNSNGTYSMKAASGFPIVQGAGLRDQISPNYKFYYNSFTIDYLLEILNNLSINILPEDKREFVLLTGERGMIQFHKAVEDKVALLNPLGNPSRLFGSNNSMGFRGQYKSYEGPQGVVITVAVMPQYDDPIDNRTIHPDGGYTESYRYTILNFGTTEGESNIVRVYPKGQKDKMWHIAGSTSPFGPNTSFNQGSASKVDGYELFVRTTQGLMIKNPMTCAELIYAS